MIDATVWLETTAVAQHLKASVWTYPLVNAGHLLGIALLIGAVVAMDLRVLGISRAGNAADAVLLLRPVAMVGFALALLCGLLLFATQATDYAGNEWFLTKIALLVAAVANAAIALRRPLRRAPAAWSLLLWPAILLTGRMIGYS